MKKIVFAALACVAIMASCNGNKTNTTPATNDTTAVADTAAGIMYEGMLPAADVAGIRYQVTLNGDSTFALTEAYMETDTEVKDSQEYTGKIETIVKDGATFYKLAIGKDDAVFLKVIDDSTLRVVGFDLEEPVATEGLNYDLKLMK